MRAQLEIIRKIDAYILGELSPNDAQAIASEIKDSAELQEIYETQQLIQQATQRRAILQQVQLFAPSIAPTSSIWTKYKLPIILSSILIAVVGIGLMILLRAENGVNPIDKDTNSLSKNNGNSISTSLEKVETQNTVPYKPVKPSSITKANNFPGGLHTWIMPEIQHFNIDPLKSNTLECQEGTLIIIPANSVVDNKGVPAQNPVKIEVIEALTIDKMIAYNLTTESKGQTLTSGGMLYIQPYVNGEKVGFSKDSPCHIEVPTDDYNGNMKTWQGQVNADGNINWVNPKEIRNYLIPVDFSTLDFLPKGFRPYFQSQLPFENYTMSSEALEDSIYYSLSANNTTRSVTQKKIDFTEGLNEINKPVVNIKNDSTDNDLAIEFPLKVKHHKTGSKASTLSIPDYNFKVNGNNTVVFVSGQFERVITLSEAVFANIELPTKKPITGVIIAKTSDCDSLVITNVTLEMNKVTTALLAYGECSTPYKTENPICYINPSSIKTLRQPNFKNTFIATREFEERLQILHTIENANPLLQLYINNIDKNMYEVDAMVAKKLTGSEKIVFTNFAAQKLTNVDLKNTNLKAIQEYYNETRKQFQTDARKEQEKLNNTSKVELRRLSKELSELQSEFLSNKNNTSSNDLSRKFSTNSINVRSITRPKNNVTQQTSYKIPWNGVGWMNIDDYIHLLAKGEKIIPVIVDSKKENQRIYQCINSLKTIIPLNQIDKSYEAHYPSANNPENVRFNSTFCVGIAKIKDEIFYSESSFNANQNSKISLIWGSVSEEELLSKLKALSPYNDKLLESINDEKKKIAEQIQLKELQELKNIEFKEKQKVIVSKQNKIIERQAKRIEFVQSLIDFIDPCCEKSVNNPVTLAATSMEILIIPFPDVEATFQGGNEMMNKYIVKNIQYPLEAIKQSVSGTVMVKVLISSQGKILSANIVNRDTKLRVLEKEAIRIVLNMPSWIPAMDKGSNVYSEIVIPINFSMS